MDWQEILLKVRNAYKYAPNRNQPISQPSYLMLLSVFENLVPLAAISSEYDNDFRRNLPGAGLSGFQSVSLLERIKNASHFANAEPLYPIAGEGIAENIRCMVGMVSTTESEAILRSHEALFKSIVDGNL